MASSLVLQLRKGVEVNVWDLDTCTKIWNAKSVSFLYCLLFVLFFVCFKYNEQASSYDFAYNFMQPAKDSLGIFTPTWFTSATFLSNDDHRKIVAGTNSHQVIFHLKSLIYMLV